MHQFTQLVIAQLKRHFYQAGIEFDNGLHFLFSILCSSNPRLKDRVTDGRMQVRRSSNGGSTCLDLRRWCSRGVIVNSEGIPPLLLCLLLLLAAQLLRGRHSLVGCLRGSPGATGAASVVRLVERSKVVETKAKRYAGGLMTFAGGALANYCLRLPG